AAIGRTTQTTRMARARFIDYIRRDSSTAFRVIMGAMSRFIDLNAWKRREHFVHYRQFANPFWSICADVDVTRLWEEAREVNTRSFSIGAIYLALGAANQSEAFRLRIRGDKVWLHDR